MAAKHSINLLQADLFPEQSLLTLVNVVGVWLGLLLIMVICSIMTEVSYSQAEVTYDGLLAEQQQKNQLIEQLESQLENKEITPALKQQLDIIQLVMQQKDALLTKLTDSNETFAGGFVMAMNDLSAMHHKDIRLQKISINSAAMSFTGLARNPQAVPAWLAGFKKSSLLSGKTFLNFKLTNNEQNITEFVVSSVASKGGGQ
ncbi:MAG: PilN domain-containing protein [Colwellia sp.]